MSKIKAFRLLLILISCLPVFPATAAIRQSAAATLSGTVVDEKDALISGATVTVINVNTNARRQATTGEDGAFTFPLLPPSNYKLRVERDGFAPAEINDLVLNVNDQRSLQIQLHVGSVGQTVTITAEAATIRDDATVATIVDRQFVENLPLNGRSFQSLIALTPGVTLTPTSGNGGQFSVNGQRTDTNYFTIDGVSSPAGANPGRDLGRSGGGALPGLAVNGGTNTLLSVDALQEFKVLTSTYAPEFGRTPGGQVQLVSRSGTNQFHGNLFDYFRNDALDAKDWFANNNGLAKPALRQNDFGGVFGGPVILPHYDGRDKTFFFFSYEGLRLRQPLTTIVLVPDLASRQAAVDRMKPIFNSFPIPNGRVFGDGSAEFAASYSNPISMDSASLRVDHSIGQRLTLFGRFTDSPSNANQRSYNLNTITQTQISPVSLTLGSTFIVNERMTNDFRMIWSRTESGSKWTQDDFGGAVVPSDSILFPEPFSRQATESFWVLDNYKFILFAGLSGLNTQRQLNFVDTFSLVAGPHHLKAGIDYRRLTPSRSLYSLYNPLFFGVADSESGIAPDLLVSIDNSKASPLFLNFSAFAQDTWNVTPRLVLTYGLRWELNPAPTERNGVPPGVASGINDPATLALAPAGTPLYKTTYNNFAPRFGISYEISNKKGFETVLRGGFGTFYDIGFGNANFAFSGDGWPYRAETFVVNAAVPVSNATQYLPPPAHVQPVAGDSLFIVGYDHNFKLPRTYQWNVAVQQSLGPNQTLTASYVGAAGRDLLRFEGVFGTNTSIDYSVLAYLIRNAATSDYHALQVQFQRRLAKGLQALVSYTWSHSIDIASQDGDPALSTEFSNPKMDRGSSDFDVRHSLSAAVTYNLPRIHGEGFYKTVLRDWSIDSIVNARSATPVDLSGASIFDLATGFFGSVRPDVVPGQPFYLDDPAAPGGRRFNPAAFVTAPAGRQGTLGRNVLRGFPLFQIDLAIHREFSISERFKLQFRAETFNLLNHPNFANPTGDLTSGEFGYSTQILSQAFGSGNGALNPLYQVGGARSMQLALKLQF